MRSISPEKLYANMQSEGPIDLVDVRSPGEFASVHAVGARSLPLGTFDADAVAASRPKAAIGPTYVICQSGGRSGQACMLLEQNGTDVVNVTGGTHAWVAAGLPVERTGERVSAALGMARKLALLAVAASMALALFYQPWFAYVGIGIWLALLVTGRGACPLGSCGVAHK